MTEDQIQRRKLTVLGLLHENHAEAGRAADQEKYLRGKLGDISLSSTIPERVTVTITTKDPNDPKRHEPLPLEVTIVVPTDHLAAFFMSAMSDSENQRWEAEDRIKNLDDEYETLKDLQPEPPGEEVVG